MSHAGTRTRTFVVDSHGIMLDDRSVIHRALFTSEMLDNAASNVSNTRVLLQSSDTLAQILCNTFPPSHYDGSNIVYAFGYGSGVLSQQSTDGDKVVVDPTKMIDVILVVQNAQLFHENNIQYNPHHYNRALLSFPFLFSKPNETFRISKQATICTRLHCATLPTNPWLTNPGLYFHLLEHEPKLKYGIVQVDDLLKDLQDWSYLYIAGRMHKPIVPIPLNEYRRLGSSKIAVVSSALRVQEAQEQRNLPAAFATALLYRWLDADPSVTSDAASFQDIDVYQQIVGLSYSGDPRLGAFEDPKKMQNIVQSQYSKFISLYQPIAQTLVREGFLSITSTTKNLSNSAVCQYQFSYDWNHPRAHDRLWRCLPPAISQLCGYSNDSVGESLPAIRTLRRVLAKQIVAPAARCQSIKGLCTTGWTKSLFYAYRKFTKGRFYKT
jgi:mitochondrial translocator assembly and maintenance protein 41